ncbi:hypothetical protein AVEN_63331-1 [Araneus ventricosus]|uniref:Uncharacterized protein n=1 Tax=Araneus ventricosus TaxID=182803 RepID=A0A4Y2UET6_ARAVE|nr:hypothetical protein AVEN_63331-1 [Araneus ventricosus]
MAVLNSGHMTRPTPEPAPASPNFHTTPAGGPMVTEYDLAHNRPHTRRIFSEIETHRPQNRDITTRPPGPDNQ